MEKYIFLGVAIIFTLVFLFSKKISKSCFSLMGIAACFGLLGYFLEVYSFAYVIFFLGLMAGIVMLSFELMLIEKIIVANEKRKENREKTISGMLLVAVLGMLVLVFKKNENYFVLKAARTMMHENIIELIKENYFVPVSLVMILIFASLICIDLIIKKE